MECNRGWQANRKLFEESNFFVCAPQAVGVVAFRNANIHPLSTSQQNNSKAILGC